MRAHTLVASAKVGEALMDNLVVGSCGFLPLHPRHSGEGIIERHASVELFEIVGEHA